MEFVGLNGQRRASRRLVLASVAAASLTLTACEGTSNQQIGQIVGAVGGAYLGSQFGEGSGKTAATIFGGVLGAYIGGSIGARLDERDYAYMDRTTNQALNQSANDTTLSWTNPDSGASGSVTPTESYTTADGTNCRKFTQSVSVDEYNEQASGVACQQSDGSWRIVG